MNISNNGVLGVKKDFFTLLTVKYMKKNLDLTKPLYSGQIFPVPWPFVVTRFHCIEVRFMVHVLKPLCKWFMKSQEVSLY